MKSSAFSFLLYVYKTIFFRFFCNPPHIMLKLSERVLFDRHILHDTPSTTLQLPLVLRRVAYLGA